MASPNCGPRGLTELITWLLAAGCTWLPCRRTRPATSCNIVRGPEQAFVGGHDRGAEVAGHLRLFRPERALVSLGVPFRPRSKELKPTKLFEEEEERKHNLWSFSFLFMD
ncbi:hypothetical protein NC651_011367 [Populus alba x Populus x berolinensis]|nr:hypothetical protein NC651_011367 [Populus alba x Populus x berolinensis]